MGVSESERGQLEGLIKSAKSEDHGLRSAGSVAGRLEGGRGWPGVSPGDAARATSNVGGTHQRLRVVPGKVSSIILLHNRLCYLYVVLFV